MLNRPDALIPMRPALHLMINGVYKIPYSSIAFFKRSWFAGSISVSGRRSGPTFLPIKFMAALTGIGFTSQNRAPISGIASS